MAGTGVAPVDQLLQNKASFNPSALLRHGMGNVTEGYVYKIGQRLHAPAKRFLRLTGSSLASYKDKDLPPSWEKSVLDCRVYAGKTPKSIHVEMHDRKLEFRVDTPEDARRWIASFESAAGQNISNYYRLGRTIGSGSFGSVRLAESKDPDDSTIYVVKVIEKGDERNRMKYRKYLDRETAILRSVRHPNIVAIYDIFESEKNLSLVMEYCDGGDLFDRISESNSLTEKDASAIFTQLLSALEYLHGKGIVHRDIKPANFLAASKEGPVVAKLTDFGLSNVQVDEADESLRTHVGTPYFLPPEIINGETYGNKVDIWAMGISLYYLLSGRFPFDGRSREEAFNRMVHAEVQFPESPWSDITDDAKDFIKCLLHKRPEMRPSAGEAMDHPWLTTTGPVTLRSIGQSYLKSLNSTVRGLVVA
eukprot:CAMPEP_0185850800 /NCGR_PEP_ID=MMETSP1354-20130828/4798_1 /TAXON_ID=708628 /ORGANISM="Erythrolobus madagascarensis, Strain CCMP3276" /LENGTH=419 /DNA_ID=CAMNT_0028551525 /DNA_START=31 /DNA_END=1290 /DNA_ORIENTATION=-